MTFHWTGPNGDSIRVTPHIDATGTPIVVMEILDGIDVSIAHVPVDRVEELVAGIRDTARQAATAQAPAWSRNGGFDQHDDYRETVP